MTFGELIRSEMKAKHLSPYKLAASSGVDVRNIYSVVSGGHKRGVAISTALKLMRALEIPYFRLAEVRL